MTNTEFAEIVAYITAGCGKPLPVESQIVYFDLLGDLPADTFRLAARRVVLEHKWATFPSVAELRAAASESARGVVSDLTPAEAWAMAWRVACDTDPECDGSFDRACRRAKAPPLVVESIRAFGLNSLCYGGDPQGVVRGQFLKVFEQLAGRDRRVALLPPAVRDQIGRHRERVNGQAVAIVGRLADSIGTPEA